MAELTKFDFMAAAWSAFVDWAYREPSIRKQFEAETKQKLLSPARHAIEAMIDHATGIDDRQARDFVDWVTINHWGEEEAPSTWKADYAKRSASTQPKIQGE